MYSVGPSAQGGYAGPIIIDARAHAWYDPDLARPPAERYETVREACVAADDAAVRSDSSECRCTLQSKSATFRA